jgi:hypothetical protein
MLPDTHLRVALPHMKGVDRRIVLISLTSFVLSLSAISSDLVSHPK